MMDRGCDASVFHTCVVMEGRGSSAARQLWPWGVAGDAGFHGRTLRDVVAEGGDFMRRLNLTEALTQLRGRDGRVLALEDLVEACVPPTLEAFMASPWGRQVTCWHASHLGLEPARFPAASPAASPAVAPTNVGRYSSKGLRI